MTALHMILNDPNLCSVFAQALKQIAGQPKLRKVAPLTEDELDRRQDALREDRAEEAAARRADDDGSVRGSLRSERFRSGL